MSKNDDKRVAIYIPFKTLQTAIEALDQGLPPQLDTSVWPSFSGGVRTQVWSAFKFLGLIDENGAVQPSLKRLVAEKDNRNIVLKEVLEAAYSKVTALAQNSASQKQLEDAMREYGVQGTETIEKAVRFYLQAAEHLGLPTSPLWKKVKATSGTVTRRKTRSKQPKVPDTPPPPPPLSDESQTADLMKVDLASGGQITLGLTDALMTKMSPGDRTFVFDLIDKMREYEEVRNKPKAAMDGRSVPAVIEPN